MVAGEISADDRARFYELILRPENDGTFAQTLKDFREQNTSSQNAYSKAYVESDWEPVVQAILQQKAERHKIRVPQKIWFRAAAAIFIGFLALSTYFILKPKPHTETAKNQYQKNPDIAPGTNKATLTLGNGTTMILDSQAIGTLAKQGNTKISKTDSGRLAYIVDNNGPSNNKPSEKSIAVSEYNTLTTPRGGQYQLILPDGTKVWLNAASSITYPTAFTGNQRLVKVTGEAYFEVVHNAKMPFVVKAGNESVTDIGTHFNINAYNDEEITKTTLLEGSVLISYNNKKQILIPGEQAQIKGNEISVIKNADLKKVMAWKDGLFHFDGDDLPTVMRSISRWYDVDVVYDFKPTDHFTGVISRNVNASEVFKMLELTGVVHFKIKDKTVTVVQ